MLETLDPSVIPDVSVKELEKENVVKHEQCAVENGLETIWTKFNFIAQRVEQLELGRGTTNLKQLKETAEGIDSENTARFGENFFEDEPPSTGRRNIESCVGIDSTAVLEVRSIHMLVINHRMWKVLPNIRSKSRDGWATSTTVGQIARLVVDVCMGRTKQRYHCVGRCSRCRRKRYVRRLCRVVGASKEVFVQHVAPVVVGNKICQVLHDVSESNVR